MEFEQVVRRRRMVRRYRPDPVPKVQLERVLSLARKTPSAGFSQGQFFVVVQDEARRGEIARLAREPDYVGRGFAPWLSVAPVHVVLCTSEPAYHERYREPDKLGPAGEERPWAVPFWYVDAGCSMMLLLLAAVSEGLAAGFLRLDGDASGAVKELLEIPQEVTIVGLVTLGFGETDRRSGSLRRGWKDESEAIRWERW